MLESPKRLHVVAFDVPYPADYGGVIDIYHKLEALHGQGLDIVLHMYHYGRLQNKRVLSKFCSSLYYYKRNTYKNPFVGNLPYIVNSRASDELLLQLQKDDAPILFEGLHCTYHLNAPSLVNRFKIVRTHNIEHHYYKHLEKSEIRYFKKYFFRIEAEKLRKYESVLKHASLLAAISPNDTKHFSKKHPNTIYLPAFHSNNEMNYPGAKGNYLLYHGNLAVPENYKAAMDLVLHVFGKVSIPSIIAGNNPPKELLQLCSKYDHITLKTQLSTEAIHSLIADAHINVLYTNQNTGIKLKLLNALYRGKFAVVNPLMVDGSGLHNLCAVAQNFEEMTAKIDEYILLDYTRAYFDKRKEILLASFGNVAGAQKMIDHIQFPLKPHAQQLTDQKSTDVISRLSSFMSYFSL